MRKLLIDKFTSTICADCARTYSLNPFVGGISTWHKGKCEICEKEKFITESRDWGGIKSEFLIEQNGTNEKTNN